MCIHPPNGVPSRTSEVYTLGAYYTEYAEVQVGGTRHDIMRPGYSCRALHDMRECRRSRTLRRIPIRHRILVGANFNPLLEVCEDPEVR